MQNTHINLKSMHFLSTLRDTHRLYYRSLTELNLVQEISVFLTLWKEEIDLVAVAEVL